MVTLSGEGYFQRGIAKKLKISLCAVQNILKKKEETGKVADRQRSGRLRATSAREDRALVRLSLSNRRASSKLLKRDLEDCSATSISTRTVRSKKKTFYGRP